MSSFNSTSSANSTSLARSFLRFTWTTSLAGSGQLLRGLRPTPELEAATWSSWAEMDELFQLAFLAGCDLQDEGLEVLTDAVLPWRWNRAAAWLGRRSLDTARFFVPADEGGFARREWRNKFDVFWRVKGVRRDLGHPPPGHRFDLAKYVEKAFGLGTYAALWAIEGLGHDYAETFLAELEASRSPGILTDASLDGLPRRVWPMLHAGLGLALSEHLLRGLTPQSPPEVFRETLDRFLAWCQAEARPEYLDTALESFGLEVRCFFAQLLPGFEEHLEVVADPRMPAYFWHGVGRALYFIPVQFLPGWGSVWHAVEMSEREAPHRLARDSSLAGLAYAFTMVNMSQPGILESLLTDHGEDLRHTAWSDGLAAAVRVRGEITPGAKTLRRFLEHRPGGRVADLWREIVTEPCRRALQGDPGASTGNLYAALQPPSSSDPVETRT